MVHKSFKSVTKYKTSVRALIRLHHIKWRIDLLQLLVKTMLVKLIDLENIPGGRWESRFGENVDRGWEKLTGGRCLSWTFFRSFEPFFFFFVKEKTDRLLRALRHRLRISALGKVRHRPARKHDSFFNYTMAN